MEGQRTKTVEDAANAVIPKWNKREEEDDVDDDDGG